MRPRGGARMIEDALAANASAIAAVRQTRGTCNGVSPRQVSRFGAAHPPKESRWLSSVVGLGLSPNTTTGRRHRRRHVNWFTAMGAPRVYSLVSLLSCIGRRSARHLARGMPLRVRRFAETLPQQSGGLVYGSATEPGSVGRVRSFPFFRCLGPFQPAPDQQIGNHVPPLLQRHDVLLRPADRTLAC